MLLDVGSVLAGIGLAVAAFLVVIAVCVVVLRLLAAVLPAPRLGEPGVTPDPAAGGGTDDGEPCGEGEEADTA